MRTENLFLGILGFLCLTAVFVLQFSHESRLLSQEKISENKITHVIPEEKKQIPEEPMAKGVVQKKSKTIKVKANNSAEEFHERSFLFFQKKKKMNCDDFCEEKWRSFLHKKDSLKHSQKVLSDLTFTYKIHGENQAYARLLALETLKESSNIYGVFYIQKTLESAFARIKENKKFKGYRNDLSDLLALWIKAMALKEFCKSHKYFSHSLIISLLCVMFTSQL